LNPLLGRLQPYPFEKLRALLAGVTPNPALKAINLSIGEPKHPTPELVKAALTSALDGLAAYPATAGTPALREAIAAWLARRYALPPLDAATQVLPVNGSREALFAFAQTVIDPAGGSARVACPNPFYQIYEGAALLAGAQPVFLNDGMAFEALDWRGVQLAYVCSPGNPTGKVLGLEDWKEIFGLADRHGFVIASDECYSEIYSDEAPPGALETAYSSTQSLANVVAFQSLSKRSGLPGLRSGFVAGDPDFIAAFGRFRNVACPQVPLPIQHVSVAAWGDEEHVEQGRALYRANFELADAILGRRYGYRRPAGAFFLWLNLADFGGGEGAATTLWKECGVKVLPGAYLARVEPDGGNPGRDCVRVALVHDADTTREALTRIVATLG